MMPSVIYVGIPELSMKLILMQLFTVNILCNWNLKYIIGTGVISLKL